MISIAWATPNPVPPALLRASDTVSAAHDRAAALGIEPSELHRAAGVHRAAWNRWRAGQGAPSLDQWMRVEDYLKTLPPPAEEPKAEAAA